MLAPDSAHVTNIAVDPLQQRSGVGTRLLLALARDAIAMAAPALTLEVRVGNVAALQLYERFGFAPAGIRKRYYEGRDDAIVMWAHDIGQPAYADRLRRHRGPDPRHHRVGGRIGMDPAEVDISLRVAPLRPVDASTVVLGIETSCDETAAALVMGGRDVLSSVVSSQVDLHAAYGGVVPEIASRAHLELLNPVVAAAVVEAGVAESRIDAVACTVGPGLIGALLVGVAGAKALALTWGVPFVAVNHLEAHLYAAFLEEPDLELPFVVLLVSGGHTMLIEMVDHGRYRLLGQTIDDAAGEAFDKVARFLGLGYPGGPAIDRIAVHGDPAAVAFPRAMLARRAATSASAGSRRRSSTTCARTPTSPPSTWPPASSRPSSMCSSTRRSRRPARSVPRAWCSAGASPPTRSCGCRRSRPASAPGCAACCPARRCAPTTPR